MSCRSAQCAIQWQGSIPGWWGKRCADHVAGREVGRESRGDPEVGREGRSDPLAGRESRGHPEAGREGCRDPVAGRESVGDPEDRRDSRGNPEDREGGGGMLWLGGSMSGILVQRESAMTAAGWLAGVGPYYLEACGRG